MKVQVKGRQDKVVVEIDNREWEACKEELENRLPFMQALQIERVQIQLQQMPDEEQCLALFHTVNGCGICIEGLHIPLEQPQLQTVSTILAGSYVFEHDMLVLGDIKPHTTITMLHGSLYVFGTVSGTIECISREAVFYGLRCEKLHIKFNDDPMQYIETSGFVKMKYQGKENQSIWHDQL